MSHRIEVVATTISGSIADWSKVERIEPLFAEHGETDVDVHTVDTHSEARALAERLVRAGGRLVISAGGSGTFNAVLEGCCDSGVALSNIRLGFLRKGSADLIGKVLRMPDKVDRAIPVFVEAIRDNCIVPCDVLQATSDRAEAAPRHFVGYGGAELFGEIPYYTENRFIKYYKGILSQLLGDLGPFFVGTSLALSARLIRRWYRRPPTWNIKVDGEQVAEGRYQAMIIVNGDLGPDLPFARSVPLGSGDFYLFAIRDLGALRVLRQLRHAWNASILNDPERHGLESFRVRNQLELHPDRVDSFLINVDGSTLDCRGTARVKIVDRINLFARRSATDTQ